MCFKELSPWFGTKQPKGWYCLNTLKNLPPWILSESTWYYYIWWLIHGTIESNFIQDVFKLLPLFCQMWAMSACPYAILYGPFCSVHLTLNRNYQIPEPPSFFLCSWNLEKPSVLNQFIKSSEVPAASLSQLGFRLSLWYLWEMVTCVRAHTQTYIHTHICFPWKTIEDFAFISWT